MDSRNFGQTHLQEVGLTKPLGDHDFFFKISCSITFMIYFKVDSMIDFSEYSNTYKHHRVISQIDIITPHAHMHHVVIIVIIVIITLLTLCNSIMSHHAQIIYYHACMLTLQTSLPSHA